MLPDTFPGKGVGISFTPRSIGEGGTPDLLIPIAGYVYLIYIYIYILIINTILYTHIVHILYTHNTQYFDA